MSNANECAADARVQRLCASKVHIVTRRFDQESWFDASEYMKSSLSDPIRVLIRNCDRHTTALAAATKTEQWRIPVQTVKSNK